MTLGDGLFFLDTNVFVYSFDRSAAHKRQRALSILDEVASTGFGVVSYQVIQEFLNVALKKVPVPMAAPDLSVYIEETLFPMCRVYPSAKLYLDALDLKIETGYSFYDSLMVASALQARCSVLLTEDMQHGRKIRGLEIRNPFIGQA